MVHLVLLIHGLWGSPAHLAAACEELEKAVPHESQHAPFAESADAPLGSSELDDWVVMVAGGMASNLTYDGIDVCASRVAWELDQKIQEIESSGRKVTSFSLTGYSLGGLVARFLLGLLHSRSPSFFDVHKPVTFSTIATPHLGIPRYNTFLSGILCWMGSKLLSRSGEQLYVADTYSDQDPRPLLEIMADPRSVFFHALEQFQDIHIFANGINDHTVPYPSAAIETIDHFAGWQEQGLEIETDERDIIQTWRRPVKPSLPQKRKWSSAIGSLPPVLRFRFPFNYLILILFPVMLPIVITLMLARLSLDTRQSARRLQQLASSGQNTSSGSSIQGLRDAIRRVERGIEAEMIDVDATPPHSHGHWVSVRMTDEQLRMSLWLNSLPLRKHVTWFPDVANSHAVIIVRDPNRFPAHNRGRRVIQQWASYVVDNASNT